MSSIYTFSPYEVQNIYALQGWGYKEEEKTGKLE